MNWDFNDRKEEVDQRKRNLVKSICCTSYIDWLQFNMQKCTLAKQRCKRYFRKHCKIYTFNTFNTGFYLWGSLWYRFWSSELQTRPDLEGFYLILVLRLPSFGVLRLQEEMLVLFPCSRRRGGAIIDKYSSDTCKAARDVCGFLLLTATRLRDRLILGAQATSCTHLNYRWIRPFSRRTRGVRAGGLGEAMHAVRASVKFFPPRQMKEDQRPTEAGLPAASVCPTNRRSAVLCRLKKTPLPGDPIA